MKKNNATANENESRMITTELTNFMQVTNKRHVLASDKPYLAIEMKPPENKDLKNNDNTAMHDLFGAFNY